MTTNATAIRDAVFTRAEAAGTWQTARRTDVPTLDGGDLPALQVLLLAERYRPQGDANAGEPRYMVEATIGISVVRGFADPATLDGSIDADVDAILNALLTDTTFISRPPAGQDGFNIEAIPSINRRRIWVQSGETYMLELRLDMTFEYPASFTPIATNWLEEIDLSGFAGTVSSQGLTVIFQVGDINVFASGPPSGANGIASSPFTLSLEGGASFTGDQSITISDGGAGGTIAPSIGAPGTGSITITPPNGGTNLTFTYTPAAAGAVTLSFAAAQPWAMPAALNFTAI